MPRSPRPAPPAAVAAESAGRTGAEPQAGPTWVPIAALRSGIRLREKGVDPEHVAVLADTFAALPPITVNRRTMAVVDGMHRLRAAQSRGEARVPVVFVEGDDFDTFALAVRLNTRSGLPLTREDRRAVIRRLLSGRPHWSDRKIASLAGVDHKTVGAVRKLSNGEFPQAGSGARTTSGREEDRADEDRGSPAGRDTHPDGMSAVGPQSSAARGAAGLRELRADPALCYSLGGRALLHLMSVTVAGPGPAAALAVVPEHRRAKVASIARGCAAHWLAVAAALDGVPSQS
jgi:ParB-like nuclease domain